MMILNDLLNLFFPKLCILCKEPLTDNEEQICLSCLCDLPFIHSHVQDGNPVLDLFTGKVHIEDATSLLLYEKGGKVQKLIHSFKYHRNKELAFIMGKLMALELQSYASFKEVDLLMPVPLHKKRMRKRGYNQAECICRGISAVWHIPLCTDALVRVSQTETQTSKNVYNRWLNVREMFALKNDYILEDKHILLIDDVITSGSTVSACAEILQDIPGIRISVLSLAVA